MSWSGTVRCGYCGDSGHNRLGCPKRKKQALDNPESYLGRQYKREQEKRKEQISNRLCSYCKQPNHNRRGCKTLKEDRALIEARQLEYRKHFAEAASKSGFGPGSLVKVPKGNSSDPWSKGFVALVTGFDWQNIDFTLQDTDTSRGWRERDRTLALVRVVSTFGYTEEENYWNSPPKFNDVMSLSLVTLSEILKGALNSESNFGQESDNPAELVGPHYQTISIPGDLDLITRPLNERFHLNPGPRADEYDKERTPLYSEHWSKVRPKDYCPDKSPRAGW